MDECPGVREGKCVDGLTPKAGRLHKACGGTGKRDVPIIPKFPCGYCAFKSSCWGKLTQTIDADGSPAWSPA